MRSFRRPWCVGIGIVFLAIITRLPALLHPRAIDDEAAYSVVANEIVEGGRPYVDAVERKPPLLFWTYAAVIKVAGKYNWMALHIVSIAWVLCTMTGLYFIGRQLFDPMTGLTAAFLYGVFQPWATWKNLAFNGELMMNLPIVWAWAIGFRHTKSKMRLELLAAGALLCAGFLLKQPAAIAAVPLAIYLLLRSYRIERGLTLRESIIQATVLTIGFFGALGLSAVVLDRQGILKEAFYWTISNHTIPHIFWGRGILSTLAFAGACLPLLVGGTLSCRDKGIWTGKEAERTALHGFLIVSIFGVAAGARFYPHYYIQLIPPLALVGAPYYTRLWSRAINPPTWILRPSITFIWLTLTLFAFFIAHLRGLALHREPSEFGQYLLMHSAPEDRVFVWGQEPEIYLEAQRRPACRFITTFPLTGYVFGEPFPHADTRNRIVPGAWATLGQDFSKHPPTYIVDLQGYPNAHYPVKDFPILAKLLATQYRPVAQNDEGLIYQHR